MKDQNKVIIFKYLTGNISSEELEKLELWLNESVENKTAFKEIKTAWIVSRAEKARGIKGKSRVWNQVLRRADVLMKDYRHIRRKQQVAVLLRAAVIVVALGIGALVMYHASNHTKTGSSKLAQIKEAAVHNDTILIEANMGSRSEVLLPDGSKVWLNGGSKLKMLPDFYNGKRTVYLTGEAFFDVTKKGENDFFRVKTSDIQIKVLGTQFNLKSYPEEGTVETTLEKGAVVIEKERNNEVISIATLSPNEKAIFIKKEGKINIEMADEGMEQSGPLKKQGRKEQILIKENVDTKLYTKWKDGHLIFKDEKFENILVRMERWYDVSIKIDNPDLKDLRFTANFKNETIEQALYALKLTHAFDYKHDIKKNLITIE